MCTPYISQPYTIQWRSSATNLGGANQEHDFFNDIVWTHMNI
jgi:hypothetical protein